MNINATLLGQMITFAIFVWFTMRFIWPMLMQQMEERKKIIADGLAAAEEGRKILANAEEEANKQVHATKSKCHKLLEDADVQAAKILEEARTQAKRERDEIIAAGHLAVERAVAKAKHDLQGQVVDIAILGAEKVLQRSVDDKDNRDILQNLAESLV